MATAHPDVVRAVRAGTVVGCISALRLHGAWTLEDGLLHVRAARGDAVRRGPGIRIHWTDERRGDRLVDSVDEALRCAIECLPWRNAVVVADSVAQLGLMPVEGVMAALQRTSRGRRVLRAFDPAAESGLETLARLALRSRRIRCRSQVVIAGVGRVDLLVGERLVLELDGMQWHAGTASIERDRQRDRELIARGYIVMRVSYRQLFEDWPSIEDQILRVVRRGDHRQRRGETQLSRHEVDRHE